MSRLRIKRIAGAVCAVIILTAGAAPFLWAGTDRVIPGVRINGTPAGGMSREELEKLVKDLNKQMKKAAADLDFETAAELRDKMIEIKKHLQEIDG